MIFQFDCGLHPARMGWESLPFFDQQDLAQIDLALITQYGEGYKRGFDFEIFPDFFFWGGVWFGVGFQDTQQEMEDSHSFSIHLANRYIILPHM